MDAFLAKKKAQSSQKDVHHSEIAGTPMTSEFCTEKIYQSARTAQSSVSTGSAAAEISAETKINPSLAKSSTLDLPSPSELIPIVPADDAEMAELVLSLCSPIARKPGKTGPWFWH